MKLKDNKFLSTKRENKNSLKKLDLPKKDYMSLIVGWSIFIYFFSAIIVLSNYSYYVLRIINLFQFFCFFLAIAFLIPIRYYRKKLNMSYYEYILINLLGIAPFLLMLTLGINRAFKGEPYVETYEIVKTTSTNGSMTYILENAHYQEYEHVRTIDLSKDVIIEGNTFFSIYFTDGILGIKMVEQQRVH